MKKGDSLVSVIIPVKCINKYLREETLPSLLKQTATNFEIIIITDKKSREHFSKTKIINLNSGPAEKRDYGARIARGEVLAFLDDDSYPRSDWLINALKIFKLSDQIAAVGGPSITPADNNIKQKASGYVWSSWLGSGGAGTYRCSLGKRREVDDFPTVNLLVKKNDFWRVGGFDCQYYPGEDTKLCLELVKTIHKKIIYDPKVVVYHHRREVFAPHLKQIGRYALHRGYFVKKFPETSFRVGYFTPSIFLTGLVLGPLFYLIIQKAGLFNIAQALLDFYLLALSIYFVLLTWTSAAVLKKERNVKLFLLTFFAILVTHIYYGAIFIKGLFTNRLER